MADEDTQEVVATPPVGWPVIGQEDADGDDLDEKTVEVLQDRARDLDISGRSSMNKGELIEAIRNAQETG